jgi:hypothetical protein
LDALEHGAWKGLEAGGVDHVAAPEFEEAGVEVEVAEGAAVFGGAPLGEEGGAVGFERGESVLGERGFIGKEEVAHETVSDLPEVGVVVGLDGAVPCEEGFSGAVKGEGDEVVEAELVFVKEVGEQIAGVGEVAGPGELRAGRVGDFAVAAGCGDGGEVAEMGAVFEGACDVPSAEAFAEGDLVSDLFAAKPVEAGTGVGAEDRFGEQSRELFGCAASVTIHAALRTGESGEFSFGVRKVEDGTEAGVDGCDFDVAAGDVTDVGLVIEVDGARIGGVDEAALEAGGGVDEELRVDGNVKGIEQAAQGLEGGVRGRGGGEAWREEELGEGIGGGAGPVGVWRGFEGGGRGLSGRRGVRGHPCEGEPQEPEPRSEPERDDPV